MSQLMQTGREHTQIYSVLVAFARGSQTLLSINVAENCTKEGGQIKAAASFSDAQAIG